MSEVLEGLFETRLALGEDSSQTVPIEECFPRLVNNQYGLFADRIKRSQGLFGWTDAEVVEVLKMRFQKLEGLTELSRWLSWLSSADKGTEEAAVATTFRRQRADESVMSFFNSINEAAACLNIKSTKVVAMVFVSRLNPRLSNKWFKEICMNAVKIEKSTHGSIDDFQCALRNYLKQINSHCILPNIKCRHCIDCNEHLYGGLFHNSLFECLAELGYGYVYYNDAGCEESGY